MNQASNPEVPARIPALETKPYPLRLWTDLQEQVKKTAKATGHKQSETMRIAIKLGLPLVPNKVQE